MYSWSQKCHFSRVLSTHIEFNHNQNCLFCSFFVGRRHCYIDSSMYFKRNCHEMSQKKDLYSLRLQWNFFETIEVLMRQNTKPWNLYIKQRVGNNMSFENETKTWLNIGKRGVYSYIELDIDSSNCSVNISGSFGVGLKIKTRMPISVQRTWKHSYGSLGNGEFII